MAVYDKNAKRIREIELSVAKGKMDPDKAKARLTTLKARGPEYWVKGYAYKRHYDEPVPNNPKSIKAAKEFDMTIKVGVKNRTYTPAELLKVRLREVFTAHLEAQAGKGGYKSAKTRCKHAHRYLGDTRLERLDNDPKTILKTIFETIIPADHPDWSPKTKWQLWSFMKSAIGNYIETNTKLTINNPFNAYPLKHHTRTRTVFPSQDEHEAVLAHIRANPLRWETRPGKGPKKVGYPAYFYPLMVIKYESGLRGMEIIPWRFEDADFEYVRGRKRPAIKTKILKKGDEEAVQWIVLTPASWMALDAYLENFQGQQERGKIWPVKNWPDALARQALDACGLTHLVPHDYRRAWTMENIEKNTKGRLNAIGRKTEESEAAYIHFNRQEQEKFYADEWEQYER